MQPIIKSVLLGSLIAAEVSYAGSDPLVSSNGVLNYVYDNSLTKDSVVIDAINATSYNPSLDATFFAIGDINASVPRYAIWKDLSFLGDRSLGTIRAIGFDILDTGISKRFSIQTSAMTLENISLETADIQFNFIGTSQNSLTLKNSELQLAEEPVIFAIAPFTLATATNSGTSVLKSFDATIDAPTTVSVNPGSELELRDTSLLNLRNSASVVNVDSGTLSLNNGGLKTSGSVMIDNNGKVDLNGADSFLNTFNLTMRNGAELNNLGSSSQVTVVGTASLDDATVSVSNEISMHSVEIGNNVLFSGQSGRHIISIDSLYGSTASTNSLSLDDVTVNVTNPLLKNGFTLNINDGALFRAGGSLELFSGAEIIVNSGGALGLFGARGFVDQGTITVNGGGALYIGSNNALLIDSTYHTTLSLAANAFMEVQGELTGVGNIGSAGSQIDIKANSSNQTEAYISPGYRQGSGLEIGTLTTDANLRFFKDGYFQTSSTSTLSSVINSAIVDGGIYKADITLVNGSEQNDQILYGAGNIDFTFAGGILVNSPSVFTADELNNKAFTVVKAQSSAATGAILTNYLTPSYDPADIAVTTGANIPALISFRVENYGVVGGKDDVTLVAEKNISNLQKNVLSPSRNKTFSTSVLTNSYNQSASSVLNSALNTVTVGQLDQNLASINPEPYSSYVTVSLEQLDWVSNTVLSKTFNHAKADENAWADVAYVDGKVDGSSDLGNFDYALKSLLVGTDIVKNDIANVGVYTGYVAQSMSEHDAASARLNSDNFHVGAYFYNAPYHSVTLTGLVGYSYGAHRSSRYTYFGNYNGTEKADYQSHSILAAIQAAYPFAQYHDVKFQLTGGLNYALYKQEEIREKGNDLRLNIDATHARMLTTGIGVKAISAPLADLYQISPTAFVNFEHDWYANDKQEHEMQGALAVMPDYKDKFYGQNRGADTLRFGFGLRSEPQTNLQINAALSRSLSNRGSESAFSADVNYRF